MAPEELTQRHAPDLLVDLASQGASFGVLAEIGLDRRRGADPRLNDLLGQFADLLVGRKMLGKATSDRAIRGRSLPMK